MTDSRRSVLRDTALGLGGAVLGAVGGLGLTVAVGRTAGTLGAGQFFQAIGAFAILSHVLKLGADTGLIRTLSRARALNRPDELRPTIAIAVIPVLTIGTIASALVWAFAPQLAVLLTNDPAADPTLLRALSPFVVVAAVLALLLAATRGLGRIVPFVAIQNISLPALRLLVVSLALVLGGSVETAVVIWALPLVGLLLPAIVLLRGALPGSSIVTGSTSAQFDRRGLVSTFWRFSSSRAVAASTEVFLEWSDVLLVAALRSTSEAGVYAAVSRSMRAGQLAEQAVRVAVSPRVSATLAVADKQASSELFLLITRIVVLLAWPFYLVLLTFGDVVLSVFGEGFEQGVSALRVMAAGMMLVMGAGMVQSMLLMGGKSRWQMSNKLIALIVYLVGNIVLIPRLGIVGAAVAWLGSAAVDTALATWQVRRRMGISYQIRRLAPAFALPLVVVGGTTLLGRALLGGTVTGLLVTGSVAAVDYLAVCWWQRRRLGLDLLTADRSGVNDAS